MSPSFNLVHGCMYWYFCFTADDDWVCTLYGVRSYLCGRIFHFHLYASAFTLTLIHSPWRQRHMVSPKQTKTAWCEDPQYCWTTTAIQTWTLHFHFLTSFQDLGGNVGPVLQNGHNLFITLHTCRHVKKWFHGINSKHGSDLPCYLHHDTQMVNYWNRHINIHPNINTLS